MQELNAYVLLCIRRFLRSGRPQLMTARYSFERGLIFWQGERCLLTPHQGCAGVLFCSALSLFILERSPEAISA